MDPQAAERYQQLTGLTARERRIMRLRWKKERLQQQQVHTRAVDGMQPESGPQVSGNTTAEGCCSSPVALLKWLRPMFAVCWLQACLG
jgi:hypothetical protein